MFFMDLISYNDLKNQVSHDKLWVCKYAIITHALTHSFQLCAFWLLEYLRGEDKIIPLGFNIKESYPKTY